MMKVVKVAVVETTTTDTVHMTTHYERNYNAESSSSSSFRLTPRVSSGTVKQKKVTVEHICLTTEHRIFSPLHNNAVYTTEVL